MQSKTKTLLNEMQIKTIVREAFSEKILSFEEVNAVYYNAIYRISLQDRNVYLKIAPRDDVEILTYEKEHHALILSRDLTININVTACVIDCYQSTAIPITLLFFTFCVWQTTSYP